MGEANIEVDMIVQNIGADQTTDFTFTVNQNDCHRVLDILKITADSIGARSISGDTEVAKVSLVGVGMRSHAGIASQMFQVMAKENINIQMISTSEIKISIVIDQKYLELAVRALHSHFKLDQPAVWYLKWYFSPVLLRKFLFKWALSKFNLVYACEALFLWERCRILSKQALKKCSFHAILCDSVKNYCGD